MAVTDFTFDTPQTVYYPSLVVNLQLRFDEGATLLPGVTSVEQLALNTGSVVAKSQPVITAPTSQDNLSKILGIVPKACVVELPGYRQAGTFAIDMEFRDLPLDPRIIRAMSVAIHLGAIPARDWGSGMSAVPNPFLQEGKRKSILTTNASNLLLAGLTDIIVVDHSTSGAFIHMEGRDFRGILLDTPVSSKTLEKVDLTQNIKAVVENIVNKLHPQGNGIQVEVNSQEWGGVVPSPATTSDVTRMQLDAAGKNIRACARGDANKMNFWDLITLYCFMVGAVPYFVGSKLRLRRSKSLFDARTADDPNAAFDPANPTPFVNGRQRAVKPPVVQKPEQYGYRRLVYGKDIYQLKFERKLGGVKVPVVECVSYDMASTQRGINPSTGEPYGLLKAQFPPKTQAAALVTNVAPGGGAPSTDVLRITVPGVKDQKKLLDIATNLYHEIGRQEMGGSIKTKNLTSFGGTGQDPDLLHLLPGDAVEVRVDASGLGVFPPPVSELTGADGRSFEEEVKAVKERVGDEALARVLVASNRGEIAQLQRTFRVANVHYDWSSTSGVAISFDFQNFLEARYGV